MFSKAELVIAECPLLDRFVAGKELLRGVCADDYRTTDVKRLVPPEQPNKYVDIAGVGRGSRDKRERNWGSAAVLGDEMDEEEEEHFWDCIDGRSWEKEG